MEQNLKLLESLKSGLIVSCQAPVNSPLHDPLVIAAMAKAALEKNQLAIKENQVLILNPEAHDMLLKLAENGVAPVWLNLKSNLLIGK